MWRGAEAAGPRGPADEAAVPIGVFWDIENCSVPRGRSALSLVQRIRDEFFRDHREVEFMAVCDIQKEHSDVIHELILAQVRSRDLGSCRASAWQKQRLAMETGLLTDGASHPISQTKRATLSLLVSGDARARERDGEERGGRQAAAATAALRGESAAAGRRAVAVRCAGRHGRGRGGGRGLGSRRRAAAVRCGGDIWAGSGVGVGGEVAGGGREVPVDGVTEGGE